MTLFGEISEPSSRALYDFEESLGPFPEEEEVYVVKENYNFASFYSYPKI